MMQIYLVPGDTGTTERALESDMMGLVFWRAWRLHILLWSPKDQVSVISLHIDFRRSLPHITWLRGRLRVCEKAWTVDHRSRRFAWRHDFSRDGGLVDEMCWTWIIDESSGCDRRIVGRIIVLVLRVEGRECVLRFLWVENGTIKEEIIGEALQIGLKGHADEVWRTIKYVCSTVRDIERWSDWRQSRIATMFCDTDCTYIEDMRVIAERIASKYYNKR
jgi:hypothetical protein